MKHGPEIALRDLTDRFSYDCMWRAEARSKKGESACGIYLPDLERVIDPAVRRAGETFHSNLDAVTVEQMCETGEKTHVLDDEKVGGDFAILRSDLPRRRLNPLARKAPPFNVLPPRKTVSARRSYCLSCIGSSRSSSPRSPI